MVVSKQISQPTMEIVGHLEPPHRKVRSRQTRHCSAQLLKSGARRRTQGSAREAAVATVSSAKKLIQCQLIRPSPRSSHAKGENYTAGVFFICLIRLALCEGSDVGASVASDECRRLSHVHECSTPLRFGNARQLLDISRPACQSACDCLHLKPSTAAMRLVGPEE